MIDDLDGIRLRFRRLFGYLRIIAAPVRRREQIRRFRTKLLFTQAFADDRQRRCDRLRAGSEQLAQNQPGQMPLLLRQGIRMPALQKGRDPLIECLLRVGWGKALRQGMPLGVAHIFQYIAAQCALDERSEACLERCRIRLLDKTLAKGLLVAEQVLVQQRGQPVQLHQRILQRRRGEQQFLPPGKSAAQSLPAAVTALVCIAQLMRLIQHNHIPGLGKKRLLVLDRKRIRHHHDSLACLRAQKRRRRKAALAQHCRIRNQGGQGEFVDHLLRPLLAQTGGTDHQQTPLALRP